MSALIGRAINSLDSVTPELNDAMSKHYEKTIGALRSTGNCSECLPLDWLPSHSEHDVLWTDT